MASPGKIHQVFLVIFLVAYSVAYSQVEARESVFFSKVKPVRRYSQLVSSSMTALAPLASVEATPAPAPALSEVEPASENYVYGFYNRQVGEFPVATTEADAKAVKKTSGGDDFMNKDAMFGSQDESQRYNKFDNYENEYTSNDDRRVNQYPDFRRGYKSNNNMHNYKYTRSYDDSMYTTQYNTEDDNTDRYTDENQYYTDKFERTKQRRFVNNGRYYNANGNGYYRVNRYNPTEEYEGVYQP